MNHSHPLLCRLLAIAALLPAVAFGQAAATSAQPAAAPAATPATPAAEAVEDRKSVV